jgi:hypothetical protein
VLPADAPNPVTADEQRQEGGMPKISLEPVERKLDEILKKLKKEALRVNLTPAQRKKLAKDIGNVKELIKRIPSNCKAYDLGI